MSNSWTGGQYSLVRAIFGLYLFVHFAALVPWAREVFERVLPRDASPLLRLFPNILAIADVAMPMLVIAAIAALCFAIGWHDRVAAIVMWYVLASLFGRNPLIANPSLPFAGWLLLLHACVPRAPFLSLAARGRVDPRGGWSMPPPLFAAMWIVMSLGYSYSGWTKLISPSWLDGSAVARVLANPLARPSFVVDLALAAPPLALQLATWGALGLELLFAPLALFRRLRPWLWLALLSLHLGLMLLIDFADLSLMMVILHLFTFNPEWVPRRAPETTDRVLYDGTCGFCHSGMRWLIAEDVTGTSFRYAPLGTERPDSVIVQTEAGEVLVRSAAALHLLARMGGLWRVIGVLFGLLPRRVRDGMYDFVARVRYRIFGRTKDACPLIPADLRTRFDS
ncbi:MAG TPA: DCC1-like thiol-disulfide oxidoreductase family protein [Thermoanaerobaculia bacterium]|jgi:predicted DCC family thiol-disulfide oxidoreductase YuxK